MATVLGIILAGQFTIYNIILTMIDWILRIKDDKEKPKWKHDNSLHSWSHLRSLLMYLFGNCIVWLSLYVPNNDGIIISFFISLISFYMTDLIITYRAAASLLRLKYSIKKNPYGLFYWFGILILYIITFIGIFYNPFRNINLTFNGLYRLYIIIYFIGLILQEIIYFMAAYVFVFKCDSSVCAQIIGFQKSIMPPFWSLAIYFHIY